MQLMSVKLSALTITLKVPASYVFVPKLQALQILAFSLVDPIIAVLPEHMAPLLLRSRMSQQCLPPVYMHAWTGRIVPLCPVTWWCCRSLGSAWLSQSVTDSNFDWQKEEHLFFNLPSRTGTHTEWELLFPFIFNAEEPGMQNINPKHSTGTPWKPVPEIKILYGQSAACSLFLPVCPFIVTVYFEAEKCELEIFSLKPFLHLALIRNDTDWFSNFSTWRELTLQFIISWNALMSAMLCTFKE